MFATSFNPQLFSMFTVEWLGPTLPYSALHVVVVVVFIPGSTKNKLSRTK